MTYKRVGCLEAPASGVAAWEHDKYGYILKHLFWGQATNGDAGCQRRYVTSKNDSGAVMKLRGDLE